MSVFNEVASGGAVSPPPTGSAQPRNPISRARFEVIASRSVAAFGVVFGVQTVPAAIAGLPHFVRPGGFLVEMLMLVTLIIVLVCAILQKGVRTAMTLGAILFFAIVVTWPLTAASPTVDEPTPWIWYLLSVATAYAAIAFPLWLATAYTIVVPSAYGVIRTMPCGGGQTVEIATLDATYAIILGGVVLVIMAMLRQAASSVDAAQSAALARYATAVRQHATEVERVQVDAIVHDSVLTTLLSAAAARTPEAQELAARMAADAIGHLHSAEAQSPEDDAVVGLDRLTDRITQAARAFSAPFEILVRGVRSQSVPVQVAEALYSATVQAMVNSMQHAGEDDVSRTLEIVGDDAPASAVVIRITDTGIGFDPQYVPVERLGLRVSIRERLLKVGGDADIVAGVGEGTAVILRWPSDEPPAVIDADGSVSAVEEFGS
jgi:signal transduction histidine kinase